MRLSAFEFVSVDLAITLLEAWSGVRAASVQEKTEHSSWPFCPDCNGLIRLLFFLCFVLPPLIRPRHVSMAQLLILGANLTSASFAYKDFRFGVSILRLNASCPKT